MSDQTSSPSEGAAASAERPVTARSLPGEARAADQTDRLTDGRTDTSVGPRTRLLLLHFLRAQHAALTGNGNDTQRG